MILDKDRELIGRINAVLVQHGEPRAQLVIDTTLDGTVSTSRPRVMLSVAEFGEREFPDTEVAWEFIQIWYMLSG